MKTGGHKVVTKQGTTIYTRLTRTGLTVHAHLGHGRTARNTKLGQIVDGMFIVRQGLVDPLGPDVLRAIIALTEHHTKEQE